jgi:hypothetical protein
MKRAVAALALLLLPELAHAQSDVQLWTSAEVRYRVARRTRLEAALELRADEDLSRLGSVLPSVAVTYDPSRRVRLGFGYRYEYERDRRGNLESAHRLHGDVSLRGDGRPLRFNYRLRFQERFEDRSSGFDTTDTIRNRLGVSYDTGRAVTPDASVELFTRLGDEDGLHTKVRFTIGAGRGFDDQEVEVFYRLEVPIDDRTDPNLHIIGIAYELDLPRK